MRKSIDAASEPRLPANPEPPLTPSSPGESRGPGLFRAPRRSFWLLLRCSVAIGAFWYLFSVIDATELLAALKRISPAMVAAAVAVMSFGIVLGAVRWRAIFEAYGATHLPSVLRLARLQLVGLFYNTFLPGAVGGDVVRGIAARDAFGSEGTTASLAVVLIDRVAGMSGLLLVATSAFILKPLPGMEGVKLWAPLGLLAAVSTVAAMGIGRAVADHLPARLARFARLLPRLRSWRPFILVLATSVVVWILLAMAGHLLISSIDGSVRLGDSMVIIPLAAAAVYFPLTVAGAGAREMAFVWLFATVGVSEADALAASLAFFSCQLVMALSGGVLSILSRTGEPRSP